MNSLVKKLPEDKPLWSYSLDYKTSDNLSIIFRSLFNANLDLSSTEDKSANLKQVLSGNNEYLKSKIFDLLLTNLWNEGFLTKNTYFIDYPKHVSGKDSKLFGDEFPFKINKYGAKYMVDLLLRWKNTDDKSYLRSIRRHSNISFESEINSLALWQKKIIRNRIFVLIDDFSTTGLSLEAGRNLLYQAGAEKVILCSIGKFTREKPKYKIYIPNKEFDSCVKKDKILKDEYKTINVDVNTNYLIKEQLESYFTDRNF